MAWRRLERLRLIQARMTLTAEERIAASAALCDRLQSLLGSLSGHCLSAYWPLRGEPDLRALLRSLHARGVRCALPVVVEKGEPLAFREWTPGCVMARGIWDIPYPADGAFVTPDIALAPVVGFDRQCYRLGYGGGYFDRTLAALRPRPRVIGVGYEAAALATIHPLPHDIPMECIVTERRVLQPESA
jgi:5,10-methenyltetrahydrofolate synthetase